MSFFIGLKKHLQTKIEECIIVNVHFDNSIKFIFKSVDLLWTT